MSVHLFASGLPPQLPMAEAKRLVGTLTPLPQSMAGDVDALLKRAIASYALGDFKKAEADLQCAVKTSPKNVLAWTAYASFHQMRDAPDRAISILDKALTSGIRDGRLYSCRAMALLDKQDMTRGVADLLEAIRCNPGDLGREYQPTSTRVLSDAAMAHGETQLLRMLKDRPAMATFLDRKDAVWNWAVRKFAGEDTGVLIEWDSDSPAPFAGHASLATRDRLPSIQVENIVDEHNSLLQSFSKLWAIAVFELNNVNIFVDWTSIDDKARRAQLSREEYVIAKIASEERTIERTRAFYAKVFLPHIQSSGYMVTNPRDWYCVDFFDKSIVVEMWRSLPHWTVYAANYDLLRAESEYINRDYNKMAGHLAAR